MIPNQRVFTNEFGLSFMQSQVSNDGGKHYRFTYTCMICGHQLNSRTGMKFHQCFQAIQKMITQNSQEKHRFAFEKILRFIASSNVAFNAIDNEYLRDAFMLFDNTFVIPGRDKLRQGMIELSQRIHDEMLFELTGKTVSLLYDGCHRWANEYQGVIIFTKDRLYIWGLINANDSKAKTIAETIASIVELLKNNSTTVISVCCDNCNSNVKALNGDEESAQQESESPFVRAPCSAHTANLGIKDLFSKGSKYYYIKKAIKVLLSNKPDESYRKGFSPTLETIRWQSLFHCACFITENYKLYEKSQNHVVIESLNIFNGQIGWQILTQILGIVWNFIQTVERDLSSIDQIVMPYLNAHSKLIEINTQLSIDMAKALEDRFLYTCPLQLPLFAFFVTKDGLYFFRRFCRQDRRFYNAAIEGITCYQIERDFDVEIIEANNKAFEDYLEIFDIKRFSDFFSAADMWEYLENTDENIGISQSFYTLAKEVLEIPSSEAAVERLFTFLSELTSGKMCNSQDETLSARLIVKLDTIFKKAGHVEWNNLAFPAYGLRIN